MAIKYARLWDPVNQFQIKSGQLNVAGRVFVRLEATDDLAQLYDENHTLMPQPVVLDNNGRSRGVFVDAAKTYWIDVQDRYGMSLFTIRKLTPCGGGGGGSSASACEVVSSDGTINVEKSIDGGVVTFDVSVADDSAESLDWIRCDGSDKLAGLDIYRPIYASGTMALGEQGVLLGADRYYHVTAHVKATKGSVSPFYENAHVTIKTRAGSTVTDVITTDNLVDYSLGLSQEFEVSADVYSPEACELLFEITSEGNATFALSDVAVHRVYSGMPQGGGAAVRYTGENGVIVNNSTDKISADFDVVQHKLTQGSNITISNNVISAQQPDVSQFVTGSEVTTQIENALANVREVPTCDASDVNKVLTVDANGDYDWSPVPSGPSGVTDVIVDGTSVVTAGVANITMPTVPTKVSQLQNDEGYIKLSDVPAQVNADWNSNSGASQILNKPSLATVATTGSYSDLSGKPSLATVATTGSYSDLSGKPSLATVATTGSYNDLSDKPTIPTPTIYTAGNGIDITGSAISAKVDGTTITTNSQGQLVATGSAPFTPVTTHFTVDGTSSIVSEICPSASMSQADTTYYYVPIPSSVFPTTGRYIMYGVIYKDMTLDPDPGWSSGQSYWGPKMSISKQDAITRAWNLQCVYTTPYGYPERSERYSISLQQYNKPEWTFADGISLRGAKLQTSGAGVGNTEKWWNNPSGVSGVNRFYTISRCGYRDFIINDTSYIPNGVIVHSIYANQSADTINDFYADLYFVKVAESPSVPYSSLVPANA